MSDQSILHDPPSTVDDTALNDALQVAPPSRRAVRTTQVLAALLLVAVGATGATWWAQRDGSGGAQRFPTGLPAGMAAGLPGGTGTSPVPSPTPLLLRRPGRTVGRCHGG